ncbi:hypothetical protein F8M41_017909 [Gigaspora margarita]|uniref:Uncharacterized protein n=1 Tax=Gigaspora margarita TaxID=4874 RepID=A0A8H4B2N9_GIGMA|nr:hypothetical protein F8M41_017909 [Gigaspora margarita]
MKVVQESEKAEMKTLNPCLENGNEVEKEDLIDGQKSTEMVIIIETELDEWHYQKSADVGDEKEMNKPGRECKKKDEQGTSIDCQKSADMKHNNNSNNMKDGNIDKISAFKDNTKSVELANTGRNIAEIDKSEAKKAGHEIFDSQGSGRRRKDSLELNNEPTGDEIEAGKKKVVRRFPSEDVVHQIF